MYKMHWENIIDVLANEDVVIDIRIYSVELCHWDLLVNRIKLKYKKNIIELKNINLNQPIDITFFNNDNERFIQLSFGEIKITLAFYEDNIIEMYSGSIIDIEYTYNLNCFFEFIEDLSNYLKKDVTIYHEGEKTFILKCAFNKNNRDWFFK